MNNKRKQVVDKILNCIRDGSISLEYGNKLPSERQLSEKIGESRFLVKEALISLETLGYVEIRDRQGVFLLDKPDYERIPELLLQNTRLWPEDILSYVIETRQILEPSVTGLAAIRRNDNNIIQLKKCINEMSSMINGEKNYNPEESTYWNSVFHTIIFDSSNNKYLTRIYESILALTGQGVTILRKDLPYHNAIERARIVLEQHIAIASAIEKSDAISAFLFSKEHLAWTLGEMVEAKQISTQSNLFDQLKFWELVG